MCITRYLIKSKYGNIISYCNDIWCPRYGRIIKIQPPIQREIERNNYC